MANQRPKDTKGPLISNFAYVQRRVDVETVNETVADVKAQALVDTVRYGITFGKFTHVATRKKTCRLRE